MKKIRVSPSLLVLAVFALASVPSLRAQISLIDTVTITAPEPNAWEAGLIPGRFEVSRSGPTNFGLSVFYRISGSASNGVDYEQLPSAVSIPPGSFTVSIPVKPIDDGLVEGDETVVLQIIPSPLMCPAPACGYEIGWPSNATVTILEDEVGPTNRPPFVQLNSPRDGDVFTAPANIPLAAYAQDPEDAYNVTVEFFAGGQSLGFGTFVPTRCAAPYCPFFALTWSNVPPGRYLLTAKATDQQGASSFSNPVGVTVTATNPPPGTNLPVVTIFAIDPIAVEGQFCWSNWWWTSSGSAAGWTTVAPGFRTNYCFTNTASFAVRRTGDTNSDLTVYYGVGGTASNGVDYVTLPGQVTIPAGHRSARIVVVPLDDRLPEPIETVVLALQPPPTGSTPAYVVGFPRRAAAIIVDNDQPRPRSCRLRSGLFHLCAPGTNGYSFSIRASSDLANWTPLGTNVVTDGAVHFVDPDASDISPRFYQVTPAPNYAPPD